MDRHRVAAATRDPRGLEPGGHPLGEIREVPVELLFRSITGIIGKRVILIGVQSLFQSCLTPQRQPRPRHRRLAQINDREREQSSRERVDRRPDHATDLRRVRSRRD